MDWDILLKIWAVVGPLIAASASAIWARHNQMEDRKHNLEQLESTRENAIEDRRLEFERSTINAHKVELRVAISQFVAAANESIMLCQQNRNGSGTPETSRLELDARSQMNTHFQSVSLLGTDEIAAAAKILLNLTAEYPLTVVNEPGDKRREHNQNYLLAKKDLSIKARQLLGLKGEA